MEAGEDKGKGEDELYGTTLRVYRFLFRQGKPMGVHEVQRGVGLQAASSAHYHLRKLVESGLVKEEGSGYFVDRVVFEDMVRIGSSLVPVQAALAAFFATVFFFLLTVLRPQQVNSVWALATVTNCISLVVFSLQTVVAFRRSHPRDVGSNRSPLS